MIKHQIIVFLHFNASQRTIIIIIIKYIWSLTVKFTQSFREIFLNNDVRGLVVIYGGLNMD